LLHELHVQSTSRSCSSEWPPESENGRCRPLFCFKFWLFCLHNHLLNNQLQSNFHFLICFPRPYNQWCCPWITNFIFPIQETRFCIFSNVSIFSFTFCKSSHRRVHCIISRQHHLREWSDHQNRSSIHQTRTWESSIPLWCMMTFNWKFSYLQCLINPSSNVTVHHPQS
jgi:hypothetical protein